MGTFFKTPNGSKLAKPSRFQIMFLCFTCCLVLFKSIALSRCVLSQV